MRKRTALRSATLLLALSVLNVACDADPSQESDDYCADGNNGKADDHSDVFDDEASLDEEHVVLLTRDNGEGVPDTTVVLEGQDALTFEGMINTGDVDDDDIERFLEGVESSVGEEAELAPESTTHREFGVCVPYINGHIKRTHVGWNQWNDDAMRRSARYTRDRQHGSWANENDAHAAVSEVVDDWCGDILLWMKTASIGDSYTAPSNGLATRGRACTPDYCDYTYKAKIHVKKIVQGFIWRAGVITTAYPYL